MPGEMLARGEELSGRIVSGATEHSDLNKLRSYQHFPPLVKGGAGGGQ